MYSVAGPTLNAWAASFVMAHQRRTNGASQWRANGALMAQIDACDGGVGPWCVPCAITTPEGRSSNGAKDGAHSPLGRSRLMAHQWRTNGANRNGA